MKSINEKAEEAKRLYETANADQRYVLERLFPDLKESEESENERIRKEIISIFKGEAGYTSKEDTDRYIAWIEKQCEQKPAEDRYMEGYLNGINDTLKTQKPAVWSEGDDEMLDSIIEEVRYIGDFPDYPTKEENELYDECLAKVDWLKSLKDRYTWKPSDEQMASITCAVRKMKESACYDSELVSLLNDLKKL